MFQPTKSTTLHAGYARYFTRPPLELVQAGDLTKFIGTTNQPAVLESSPVKAERAHYFDAGITEGFTRSFSMGVDAYYKEARDLIDEGQFGAALIFSPFNYARGNQYGVEVTANYAAGGFSAYANFGFERGTGKKIVSGQFLFSPDELAFIATTSSFWIMTNAIPPPPASPTVTRARRLTRICCMAMACAAGLPTRTRFPPIYIFNVGFTHNVRLPKFGKVQLRFDIVNLFDKGYELRSGSGIGVFAPQFGPRRGFFGGISWLF